MDEQQKKVMKKAEAEIEAVIGRPPLSGEPEIDAIIEQHEYRRQLWVGFFTAILSGKATFTRYITRQTVAEAREAADLALTEYVERWGDKNEPA
jgi:hypothetical protein